MKEQTNINSKEKCIRDYMWSRKPTTVNVWPFVESFSDPDLEEGGNPTNLW